MLGDTDGSPWTYYFGCFGRFNALVMDRPGPSLEDMFDLCDRHFTVKTAITCALQMIYSGNQAKLLPRDLAAKKFSEILKPG